MEWKRQGIHIAAALFIPLLAFIPYWGVFCLVLAGVFFNQFVLPRLLPGMVRGESDKRRGLAFYPSAILTLVVLFPNRLEVVAGAWALLGFGDSAATLIGKLGKPSPLRWNPNKTFQGSLAFIVFGGLACLGSIVWVDPECLADLPKWAIAVGVATLVTAWVESLPLPMNDNLTVPFMGAAILFLVDYIDVGQLAQLNGWYMVVAILANGCLASILTSFRVIQGSATWAGVILGSLLWVCGGWQAYLILILFFVLGTLSTRYGYRYKDQRGVAQEAGGRRSARHVIANCAVPTTFAFLAASTGYPEWMQVALVAALATAMFDTLSSEIGQVLGRSPTLSTTGKPVPIGAEGAVSMEGTLAGLAGALFLASVAWLVGSYPALAIPIVVTAAFTGSSFESLIAAYHKDDFPLRNELLNVANTAIGGCVALYIASEVLSKV